MEIIRVEGLAKSYDGHQVLKDLTLTINKGECFTLLGPSGCGKTVLLRLIAGFETPDAGRILIDNQVVSDPAAGINISPDIRGIGVVFQDYAVWPHMSVFDNVGFPLKIAKRPPNELKSRVMETLELVAMDNLAHRLPSELSGGQQQRVALARAIVANSSLMLLDEPLSNLDAKLREEMRFEIKELQRKLNITVLYVTHDQEIALALSDRMAIMDNEGRIRQIGNPWEIFERPVDPFVFNFMGIANFMPVRQVGATYLVGNGDQIVPWASPQGSAANWVAGFRPSDVNLAPQGQGLRGLVKRASFLGSMIDYLIEIDGTHLRTSVETHEAMSRGLLFKEGDSCTVSFRDLLWFDAKSLAEVKKQ